MRTKSGKTSVIVLSGHGVTVELLRHDDAKALGGSASRPRLCQSGTSRRELGQDPRGTESAKCADRVWALPREGRCHGQLHHQR
jgi:hypothetical protein